MASHILDLRFLQQGAWKIWSSGLYCCVGQREPNNSEEQLNLAHVSAGFLSDTLEECITSIFDPEDGGHMFLWGSLSTTQCYNPEDCTLQIIGFGILQQIKHCHFPFNV
jgi:hypothetical protein